MKVEERLFSIPEVAERLGVSKYTVNEWLKVGRIKGTRIGRFWRVRERDLEAFIENPPPLERKPTDIDTEALPPLPPITIEHED